MKPPLIVSPRGMVRFQMANVSWGKIPLSSEKNVCRFSREQQFLQVQESVSDIHALLIVVHRLADHGEL
ncbi:hypothetical protein EYF80_039302 [Liparis tanakae]|uniref:Uncharacterized protein n=1 Tax=Liparis tanakae TaxID=230148 RepID=A0A4Z2GCW8_9TELE|nr:hypothetical protein EYF80_039302 [Liparis tanakae]